MNMIRGPVSEHIAHYYHWQVAGLEYASLHGATCAYTRACGLMARVIGLGGSNRSAE